MRFATTIFATLFLLPFFASAQDTFRGVQWGSSKAEIRAEEGEEGAVDGNSLYFEDEVVGLPVLLSYQFPEGHDKFGRSMYLFVNEHMNKTRFLDDFEKVESALREKYGAPVRSNTNWRDDLYRDDRSRWGTAIAVGDMEKRTVWKTDGGKTKIYHMITGDNGKIAHSIHYRRPSMSGLYEEARRRENAEDL